MANFTHTQSNSWSNGGSSSSLRGQVQITDTRENNLSINQATGTTNVLVAFAQVAAKIQMLALQSNVDCTIKTNSSGSPANTFNLKAGILEIWSSSSGIFANPVTTDITSLFVTNASGQQARISIRVLSDT